MIMRLKCCFIVLVLVCCDMVYSQSKSDISKFPVHATFNQDNKPLLIFLTGDGGWNNFSVQLSEELVKNGFAVVSLDTRKYFWAAKTPVQFATDMGRILDHYLNEWNKNSFSFVGYSFGAEVAAFLPNSLSNYGNKFHSMVLLSPGYSSSFEVKWINFPSSTTNKEKYKVYPQLLSSKVPITCIFGENEKTDFSTELKSTKNINKVVIPGSHHYNDDIKRIAATVVSNLK